MTQDNGNVPDAALAGHLVIYADGVVAFRADGAEDVVHPSLPPLLTPLLVKLLSGEQLTLADVPGGMRGRVKAMMGRG